MSKRKLTSCGPQTANKRCKVASASTRDHSVDQPLLKYCYREVKTLKSYIYDALPPSSRVRRKRLLSACNDNSELSQLLNNVVVGLQDQASSAAAQTRSQDLQHFTQARRSTQPPSATGHQTTVSEVVDFVIWSLFKDQDTGQKKPSHLLCHGLERAVTSNLLNNSDYKILLPGVLQRRPNRCADELSNSVWQAAISLAGADGELIFANLLLDCGVFVLLCEHKNAYRQLSGIPVHELCSKSTYASPVGSPTALRRPGEIAMVRNRMLYSKPSLSKDGRVLVGLKHMHVLNRMARLECREQDLVVMRYMFPKQFKMHNVFTSAVDRRQTVQPFKDYIFREDELRLLSDRDRLRVPKRLRGAPLQLVRRLRKSHSRCSYHQLLAHYCPIPAPGTSMPRPRTYNLSSCTETFSAVDTQMPPPSNASSSSPLTEAEDHETSFLPYTTSAIQVSTFCQATIKNLLPAETFGVGAAGKENWCAIMSSIDRFIKMRRFESVTLHEIVQRVKLRSILWLIPVNTPVKQKLSITEKKKRDELLHELVYYLFDSLLIPLVASNFYVTESGVHRNKILYFRHDVWRRLCQPALVAARLGTLVPVPNKKAQVTEVDQLGYSTVRLLPKEEGTRAITNLRRRPMKTVHGKMTLLPSTNTRLAPLFNIFNFERQRDTGIFHTDSFSIQDLHQKLAAFKARRAASNSGPCYFVKVDIQSAFDSIPQDKLLELVNQIFKHGAYQMLKHAESKLIRPAKTESGARPRTRFIGFARPACEASAQPHVHGIPMRSRNGAIVSDVDSHQCFTVEKASRLLEQHVKHNTVLIGNKYYKQTTGIPQGSILSSLLCTFFYNHFENQRLGFLNPEHSLLLRVIDDFLLISTQKEQAVQFVRAMKSGDQSYGICVHPEKSMVNFDMTVHGTQIPKVSDTARFPFCGLYLDTRTLEVTKGRVRKDNDIGNTLTVDIHGHPGDKLVRRIMSSLRIQLQGILLDSAINNRLLIAQTLSESFQETAMKMHQYLISLPAAKRPSQEFLIGLIGKLTQLVVRTMRDGRPCGETFTRQQICYIAAISVWQVLSTRKARYTPMLAWLENLEAETRHSLDIGQGAMKQIVEKAARSLEHYQY